MQVGSFTRFCRREDVGLSGGHTSRILAVSRVEQTDDGIPGAARPATRGSEEAKSTGFRGLGRGRPRNGL